MHNSRRTRWLLLGVIGLALTAGLWACAKKDDPAVTSAGGGASSQSVMTVKGAAS